MEWVRCARRTRKQQLDRRDLAANELRWPLLALDFVDCLDLLDFAFLCPLHRRRRRDNMKNSTEDVACMRTGLQHTASRDVSAART